MIKKKIIYSTNNEANKLKYNKQRLINFRTKSLNKGNKSSSLKKLNNDIVIMNMPPLNKLDLI